MELEIVIKFSLSVNTSINFGCEPAWLHKVQDSAKSILNYEQLLSFED